MISHPPRLTLTATLFPSPPLFRSFVGDESAPPYRVFMRFNPMNAGGGAALYHSFLVTYGKGVTGESLKYILGHEMTHTWTANDLGKWYDEGNAVYYQALLPWRSEEHTSELQYIMRTTYAGVCFK